MGQRYRLSAIYIEKITLILAANKRQGGLRTQERFKKPMPGQPLVTVVTATLNGQAYLSETIKSVANQTYPNVEHVIIDGGSHDGTLSIIAEHEDKIDYWISEPDHGMYEALNKGIRLSKGRILTFLNADDYFDNDRVIERVVNEFERSADTDWVYCDVRILHQDTKSYVYKIPPYEWESLLSMGWCYIPHPGSFFRRELFDRLGLFDERYRLVGDYEFFLRIGDKSKGQHLAGPAVVYRHHAERLTECGSKERKIEHRAVQQKFATSGKNSFLRLRAFMLTSRFRLLNLNIYLALLFRWLKSSICSVLKPTNEFRSCTGKK